MLPILYPNDRMLSFKAWPLASVLALALLLMLVLPAPAASGQAQSLPSIGGAGGGLISSQQEREIRDQVMIALRRNAPLLNDPMMMDYLEETVYRMVPHAELDDRELTIIIIDDPALNAFAVPGGIIGINAGLMIHAEDEHQFASVIAHEIAHISQRHFARRLEQQRQATPLTIAGMVAGILLTAATGSEAGIAAIAGTQALSVDAMLRHSRAHEQEADRVGIDLMAEAGYDPAGMPRMFEQMLRQSRLQGNRPPEWLSTHPLTESRVGDTASRAQQFQDRQYSENIEYHLMRARVMVRFTETKSDAVTRFRSRAESSEGDKRIVARYGLAYALHQDGKPEQAIEILRELLEVEEGRISFVASLGKALKDAGKTEEAIELLEFHADRHRGNLTLTRTLADVHMKANQPQRAARLYERLTRSHGGDHTLWQDLADANGRAGNIVEVHRAHGERDLLLGDAEAAVRQFKQALDKAGADHTRIELLRERLGAANEQVSNRRQVVR